MRARRKAAVFAIAATLGAAMAAVVLFDRSPVPAPIAGMVRQTEIRMAPEITGTTDVACGQNVGQQVHKGDLLAVLDNPELAASLSEAKAAVSAARAERDRVFAGVRAEEVLDPGPKHADRRGEPAASTAGDHAHGGADGAGLRQPPGPRRPNGGPCEDRGGFRSQARGACAPPVPAPPWRSAHWRTRVSHSPKPRRTTCRPSSIRHALWHRWTARSVSSSSSKARSCRWGKPVLVLEHGQAVVCLHAA